jgi:hypothetical protein
VAVLKIIILTHQEELNLPHALRRLKGLDCEIFVLWKIAELFGARPMLLEDEARRPRGPGANN